MTRSLVHRRSSMVLAAGLALALPRTLPAQIRGPSSTTGADLPTSSGSGSGNATGSATGTGGTSSTGSGGTMTGSPAGMRTGSQGFGTGRPGGPGVPPVGVGRGPNTGPGGGSHLPDDPSLVPLEAIQGPSPSEIGKLSEAMTVDPKLLRRARDITDSSQRSLALQRLASVAIFSNELSVAHHALSEASRSALDMTPSLPRDQRLIAIVTTLLNLAEADLREGRIDMAVPEVAEALEPLPKVDRDKLVRRARLEWRRAAYLADFISNPTYRTWMFHRIVEDQSAGSLMIANEFPKEDGSKKDEKGKPASFAAVADDVLGDAAAEAARIEWPVWRDRALVAAATNAALSKQYARALAIARMIPQPEVRTDALVKIAESQAKSDQPDSATATYAEAARSVASIPLDDPRAVLTGVLIDNLIAVGRFEDARASVTLYPDGPRRLIALGAIAESQGRRGVGDSAREWIAREIPERDRPLLYRRVSDGIIWSVEQNRSRALSTRSEK